MKYEGILQTRDGEHVRDSIGVEVRPEPRVMVSLGSSGQLWTGSLSDAKMLYHLLGKALRSTGEDIVNLACESAAEIHRQTLREARSQA